MKQAEKQRLWQLLGPGILFSGAAIGTSHLVQATRAGADYGIGLLGVILLANLIKYPAFRFGPSYAAVTGKSLISAYKNIGNWAVLAIAASQFFVQAIIIAATGLTTAAIAVAVFDISLDIKLVTTLMIILSGIVLKLGGMKWLDRLTKIFILIITLSTIVATLLAIPYVDWSMSPLIPVRWEAATSFPFIIALIGFMPSDLSLSILHSLWSEDKAKTSAHKPNLTNVMMDFNVGYICSVFLAICFMVMGAGVLYSNGITPADGAGPFAKQIISLYTNSLGAWSGWLVGVAAFGVMFTTLITILDGMPRVHAATVLSFWDERVVKEKASLTPSSVHTLAMVLLSVGAVSILYFLMRNFKDFIDLVIITAFVTGPLIATLNHLAITSKEVPEALRPGKIMRLWSALGIVMLSVMAIAYLYTLIPF